MAGQKLTEKSVASALKSGAHLLITQPEGTPGSEVESVRRAPISALLDTTLTMPGAAADAGAAGDMLAALAIKENASGSVVNFENGAGGLKMPQVKVVVEPIQAGSGDPSPSNPRAISSYSGCRVWHTDIPVYAWLTMPNTNTTVSDITIKVEEGLKISITGTASADEDITLQLEQPIIMPSNAWARFHFMGKTDGGLSVTIGAFTKDLATGDLNIVSVGATTIDSIQINITSGTTYDVDGMLFALNSGDDVPTMADVYDEAWSDGGKPVYGGSYDMVTGVLTIDWASIVLNGSEDWIGDVGNNGWRAHIRNMVVPIDNQSTGEMCSHLRWVSAGSIGLNGKMDAFQVTYNGRLYVCVTGITSTTALQQWLSENNVTVVWKIPPKTYELNPQHIRSMLGANGMGVDVGRLEVTYCADTKLYIDAALAAST